MTIQKSAEDYLEAILILSKKHGDYVRSIDIANYLEYSKPSFTSFTMRSKVSMLRTSFERSDNGW